MTEAITWKQNIQTYRIKHLKIKKGTEGIDKNCENP